MSSVNMDSKRIYISSLEFSAKFGQIVVEKNEKYDFYDVVAKKNGVKRYYFLTSNPYILAMPGVKIPETPMFPTLGSKDEIESYLQKYHDDLYVHNISLRPGDEEYMLDMDVKEEKQPNTQTSSPVSDTKKTVERVKSEEELVYEAEVLNMQEKKEETPSSDVFSQKEMEKMWFTCPICGARTHHMDCGSVNVRAGEKYVLKERTINIRTREITYAQPYVTVSICNKCWKKRHNMQVVLYVLFGPVLYFSLLFIFLAKPHEGVLSCILVPFLPVMLICGLIMSAFKYADIDLSKAEKCKAILKLDSFLR